MKFFLYAISILAFLFPIPNGYAQLDSFRNTISIDNLDVKRFKLILGPGLKGGGVRSYIFEIDDKNLGMVNYTWGSRRGHIAEFVSAYRWNSKNWKRIPNRQVKLSQNIDKRRMTFCGDFHKLRDMCILYDFYDYQNPGNRPTLISIEEKYGLEIKRIGGRDFRFHIFRSYVFAAGKYLCYFIALIFLLRFLFLKYKTSN